MVSSRGAQIHEAGRTGGRASAPILTSPMKNRELGQGRTEEEIAKFRKTVCDPQNWRNTAFSLVCAANVLRRDYHGPFLGVARQGRLRGSALSRQRHTHPGPMLVLYAFAVENLLK